MIRARSLVRRQPQAATSVAAIAVAVALMLLPAVWNGYPLFYFDSVDYVQVPFTWELPLFRTMPYAMMGLLGKLAGTLWVIPLLQSLVVAWILHEALAVFGRLPPGVALVPVAAALSLFSGLPWFASQIMADVFAGVVVLGIAVLAVGGGRLGLGRLLAVAVLVAVGVCLHTSHLAVGAGLVLCLGVARLAWRRGRIALLPPFLAVLGGALLIVSIHWATMGRPFLTQPSNKLMLGRLVQDGLAKRYLDEVCPNGTVKLKLCRYRDDPLMSATANEFLWTWRPSPFKAIGGWHADEAEAEAAQVVRGTLALYPLGHVEAAARLTVQQFFMLQTGDGLLDMHAHAKKEIARFYPHELQWFSRARQHVRRLTPNQEAPPMAGGIDFAPWNALHVPAFLAALATMLVLMGRWWRRSERRLVFLSATVALALLGNAFVCGALSNPNHRYQSRLAWLPLLVIAIAALRRVEDMVLADEVAPVRVEA